MATIQYEKVTQRELRDLLDMLAREKLGISAEEFIDRYRARTLDGASPAISRLADIARLLLTAAGKTL